MKRMVRIAIVALAFAAAAAAEDPALPERLSGRFRDPAAMRRLAAANPPGDAWEKRLSGGSLQVLTHRPGGRPLDCRQCHREIVAQYARTPKANTSGEGPEAFIGSGRVGRSFLYRSGGGWFQSPSAYYTASRTWDLAPGFTSLDSSRQVGTDCFYCHSSGGEPGGIGCERCHGDTTDHRRIVNPAKLAGRRRDAVCEQCHLAGEVRITRAGRDLGRFQPGEDLASYLEVLVRPAGPEGMRVNGHAESLAVSHCRLRAGDRIWCGTCHGVHGAASTFREMCLTCHQRPHRDDDCVECHMPKSPAFDGGGTVFTDHRIPNLEVLPGKRPGPPSQLLSYFTGPRIGARELGLAHAELAVRYQDPAWIEKAWPLLREEAARHPADPLLRSRIGAILRVDSGKP